MHAISALGQKASVTLALGTEYCPRQTHVSLGTHIVSVHIILVKL